MFEEMEDGNSEKEIVVDTPGFLETPNHLITDHLVETQEWTFLWENPVAEEPKRTFMDPVAVVGFGWFCCCCFLLLTFLESVAL